MTDATTVDFTTTLDDGVLRITLNRPDRLNALSTEMLNLLADVIEGTEGVRVAVITGEGRAFCTGAVMQPGVVNEGILSAAERLIRTLTAAPFPIVAAVNGIAAGLGCSIAIACDVQIAKSSSYVLQAFINVGLMPDGAATELLAASIGRTRALELLLGGEKLSNDEAARIGLLTRSVADEEFEQTVDRYVQKFLVGPPLAYKQTKAAVNAASLPTLGDSLQRETDGQTFLIATDDFSEGVAAFAEKRPAKFVGR